MEKIQTIEVIREHDVLILEKENHNRKAEKARSAFR